MPRCVVIDSEGTEAEVSRIYVVNRAETSYQTSTVKLLEKYVDQQEHKIKFEDMTLFEGEKQNG